MDSKSLKLENTKALVQLHNENKISFSDCIRKISIVGDLNFLDENQLDNGKIEINKEVQ